MKHTPKIYTKDQLIDAIYNDEPDIKSLAEMQDLPLDDQGDLITSEMSNYYVVTWPEHVTTPKVNTDVSCIREFDNLREAVEWYPDNDLIETAYAIIPLEPCPGGFGEYQHNGLQNTNWYSDENDLRNAIQESVDNNIFYFDDDPYDLADEQAGEEIDNISRRIHNEIGALYYVEDGDHSYYFLAVDGDGVWDDEDFITI